MSKQEQKELGLKADTVGFFDIDDTLTKGNTTVCFGEFLAKRKILPSDSWNLIQNDLQAYKASMKDTEAYRIFAVGVLKHFAYGLKGLETGSITKEAEVFLQQTLLHKLDGYEIRDFSKQLVGIVNMKGTSVAVSGSPLEILTPLSRYLGFNVLETTWFGKDDGRFSGEVIRNLALDEEKIKVVTAFQIRSPFSKSKSFAFGDSPHDCPLLEAVDNSFVIGSNQVLCELARQKGWHVSTSGDEIIEEVERRISIAS